jgi:hypothetical protein
MSSIGEIIEKIKDIISIQTGNKKVFDKNVAYVLGLSQEKLAINKLRNKIPFEEVLEFALRYRVDANWLFFGIRIVKQIGG